MHKFSNLITPQFLMAPEGGGGGGGGGTGDGGTGDGGAGGGGGDDLPEATRDLIMRTVNAAVSNQMGRKLPAAITEAMSPLQESISALTSQFQPQGGQQGGQGGQQGGNQSPEMAELLRKQKALEAQLEEERGARQQQETQAREQKKSSATQNALAAAGVEPLRMRGAMAEVLANVKLGEDGKPFYRDTSKGYEEDLSIQDGISRWASTDVGKSYLAPKNVQGSGSTPPGRSGGPKPGNRPTDPKAAKAQRIAEARQQLRGQVREMLGSSAGIPLGGTGSEG